MNNTGNDETATHTSDDLQASALLNVFWLQSCATFLPFQTRAGLKKFLRKESLMTSMGD